MTATNQRVQNLKAKGINEFKRFVIIFVYLWVVFGLFSLNQAIILRNLSYLTHGFALLNAVIFAKVMLIAEDLKLGDRFQSRPLIYPVSYKTVAFSVVFLLFHLLEEAIVAWWHGRNIAETFPVLGDSTFIGAVCVWGVLSISLIPFFAVREISRVLGEHELWSLFFRRGTTTTDGLRLSITPRP